MTRPTEEVTMDWKAARSIQSLASWEAEYEQNGAISATCACWGRMSTGCALSPWGEKTLQLNYLFLPKAPILSDFSRKMEEVNHTQ